ncbi:putative spermidine/putrescine transport system substrate-binding protein [Catenulispora sp. GAS73]
MAIVRSVSPGRRYGSITARLAAVVAAVALVAGCSSGPGSGTAGAFVPPPVPMAEPGAVSEGDLYMVVWDGYAEPQWVQPFEHQTGCTVHAETAGSSDEMVADVKTGRYDLVSASGDASLRMIASGDVAPVDVSKVPDYAQINSTLENKRWNAVNGVPYGVPQGRGANVLIYNKDKVAAPTSLGAVFNPDPSAAGHLSVYDSPITIADAALYLMHSQPSLGIKDPYSLHPAQFQAVVALLTKQRAAVGDYWPSTAAQQSAFAKGADSIGIGWQVVVNGLQKSGHADIATAKPVEGSTGWSDTWMVTSTAKNLNCAYKWLAYITSAQVNAQVAEYVGEAPANTQACTKTADPGFCATYHADDPSYWADVHYWATPTAHCLDGTGDDCASYPQWVAAWNRIKQQ